MLTACLEDKGNYEYTDLAEIKVEGIPAKVEVLGYVENITVTPTITSSLEGEITADNPNYTFSYRLGHKGMGYMSIADGVGHVWIDITPKSGLKLDIPANYSSGDYICWFTITDIRNNVVTSNFFDISVTSTTYEGWLVLCNEGAEERVRLDMISNISSTRIETIHDVAAGLPVVHHATGLGFIPLLSTPGDLLSIFSRERSFQIDRATLESDELGEFNLNRFIIDPGETMIREFPFPATTYNWQVKFRFAFSELGNAYLQDANSGGSAYGLPINTLSAGKPAEFRVAPFAGFSCVRPWSTSYAANALFYDSDNKRFLAFLGNTAEQKLSVIPDPAQGKLFSFTTGLNMVYMESTRRSNGLVYSILQDDSGNRSIYGINMGGNGFVQELYDANVAAPGFAQAEHFAFHSQFPLMFYAVGNKVYLYNLGTKTSKELTNIGLGTSEQVTCLKFNLYRNPVYTALTNQSEDFMNRQYQLIVASYDTAAAGVNNGKVTFWKVDGVNDAVSKAVGYSGFARIVDIVYRERAK